MKVYIWILLIVIYMEILLLVGSMLTYILPGLIYLNLPEHYFKDYEYTRLLWLKRLSYINICVGFIVMITVTSVTVYTTFNRHALH